MAKRVIEFELERATKNTYRYFEVEDPRTPPTIRVLYIRKITFGGAPPPEKIQVTLSWEEK